jgi:hypothetical protein
MNTKSKLTIISMLFFGLVISACVPRSDEPIVINEGQVPGEQERSLEIVTLLPKDAIRAIDDPEFLTPETAGTEYSDEELVIGVDFNGDARAYSISYLSSREIVNDVVGGVPLAVTW